MKFLLPITVFITSFSGTVISQNSNPSDSILQKKIDKLEEFEKKANKLKITGWVQAQFQVAESRGQSSYDGGNFSPGQFDRFMIRRGRIKFTYTQNLSQYVLQLNATERGVNLVEIFAKVTDPWTKSISLTGGVMNRPFGFEIQQSSADRETPERSRYVQMLLPNERDLGAMLSYQPAKESKLYGLKVDAGIYSGNGIYVPGTGSTGSTGSTTAAGLIDSDNFKDIMARAHYKKSFKDEKYSIGLGLSHYYGAIAYQNENVYNHIEIDNSGKKIWVAENSGGYTGKRAPRIYYSGELQFSIKSKIGTTILRGEYMTGKQSGSLSDTRSPNIITYNSAETVIRQFNGGNIYFVQRVGKSKHEVVAKYEWYDPNTKISGSDFIAGTSFKSAEIKYQMLGVGYVNYWDENVKFMIYYNLVKNEKAEGIAGFEKDKLDNVLTIRIQYRF